MRFLRRRGLRLIERNYSCREGEIDLIMADGDTLVFVEVRMRTRDDYGGAAASVTPSKQAKMARTALRFMQQHDSGTDRPARFDVVALDGGTDIDWLRSAFECTEAQSRVRP